MKRWHITVALARANKVTLSRLLALIVQLGVPSLFLMSTGLVLRTGFYEMWRVLWEIAHDSAAYGPCVAYGACVTYGACVVYVADECAISLKYTESKQFPYYYVAMFNRELCLPNYIPPLYPYSSYINNELSRKYV